jgi:transcriptional regulator with XRE-family HTH domain
MEAKQNIIGEQLKHLRQSHGLTQDNLAARCASRGWNVSENTITKIETGIRCVTDKELVILTSALRVKMKDLFSKHPKLF